MVSLFLTLKLKFQIYFLIIFKILLNAKKIKLLLFQEATFEPEDAVIDNGLYILNDKSFKKAVESGSFFIKFYAPWCGHCQVGQRVF
jgi:hypothetical protein